MSASIALINQSSISDLEVKGFVRAINKQITYDFSPHWERYATVWFAGSKPPTSTSSWLVTLMDEPTGGGVQNLGEHMVVGKDIIPTGFVYISYARRDNTPWTGVASHEILEMLGNEWVNNTVMRLRTDGLIELWPREVSDPVQGCLYPVDGILLSDFALPEYYSDIADGPYDFLKLIKQPFGIAPSGYSSILQIEASKSPIEKIVYGFKYPAWRKEQGHEARPQRYSWASLHLPRTVETLLNKDVSHET